MTQQQKQQQQQQQHSSSSSTTEVERTRPTESADSSSFFPIPIDFIELLSMLDVLPNIPPPPLSAPPPSASPPPPLSAPPPPPVIPPSNEPQPCTARHTLSY